MTPNKITVHCSATPPSQKLTASSIRMMHLNKGWRDIGYQYVIRRDGATEKGRPDDVIGAHVKGHNNHNLGICLVGGVDKNDRPEQNYTDIQYHALYALIMDLCKRYNIPYQEVYGHRDWFPDSNGDGIVDSRDWLKDCPCFDVKEWLSEQLKINLNNMESL
jgi:N-acetyl-anhydromuramyl-L-alanine amidase AmpD